MNRLIINGKVYDAPDNSSITIINGNLMVNGQQQVNLNSIEEKEINITIEGDVNTLSFDGKGTIKNGRINNLINDGHLTCGDVEGNVTNSGHIQCGRIAGNILSNSGHIKSSMF